MGAGAQRHAPGRAWVAILGFIRIATHRQILTQPLPVATVCACARVAGQPYVTLVDPGARHAEILVGLLESLGKGNLTTDAHPAALAIEHQAELHPTDADFGRFPGLRSVNPVA